MLSKVTRGPYKAVNCDVYCNGSVLLAGSTDYGDRFVDDKQSEANAQLLAASYDHALLLAAITAGIIERGVDRLWVIRKSTPQFLTGMCYPLDIGHFGCPILTDELRAELERLLGITR